MDKRIERIRKKFPLLGFGSVWASNGEETRPIRILAELVVEQHELIRALQDRIDEITEKLNPPAFAIDEEVAELLIKNTYMRGGQRFYTVVNKNNDTYSISESNLIDLNTLAKGRPLKQEPLLVNSCK